MTTFRRLIIFLAQILALFFVALSTLCGAFAGEQLLDSLPMVGQVLAGLTGSEAMFLGGLAGFFLSMILTAIFFVLVEIAYNTRNPFND